MKTTYTTCDICGGICREPAYPRRALAFAHDQPSWKSFHTKASPGFQALNAYTDFCENCYLNVARIFDETREKLDRLVGSVTPATGSREVVGGC